MLDSWISETFFKPSSPGMGYSLNTIPLTYSHFCFSLGSHSNKVLPFEARGHEKLNKKFLHPIEQWFKPFPDLIVIFLTKQIIDSITPH